MKKIRSVGLSAVVFAVLLSVCIWFVSWTLRLAFDNTCIDLEEQYSYSEASDIVTEIENGIRFGKSLENYYGMERILERLKNLIPGDAEAAILGDQGEPLYTTFQGKDIEREYTARFFSADYREKEGTGVSFGSRRSMILPIQDHDQSMIGKAVLIYDKEALIPSQESPWLLEAGLVLALTLIITVFYALVEGGSKQRTRFSARTVRIFPVVMVLAGLLVEMSLLYTSYQGQYETMIYKNAGRLSENARDKVADLMEKGLPPERLGDVSPYFEEKALDNDIIWNIRIVRSYMDTADNLARTDQDTILHPLSEEQNFDILVTVNRRFIEGQMWRVTASFAVIFIICLMISYEVMKLIDIMKLRMEETRSKEQKAKNTHGAISLGIKLTSFVAYTAIYASMPYAAVLMRTWKATVFGLSPEISASLPLTMELTGIMLFSAIIPKVCQKMNIRMLSAASILILLGGNFGCSMVESPYMLLLMRGICSLGFALFKYLMNSVVAAGSEDPKSVGQNFALFNAGLLGGITVGGAVGAIVADAKGYQFNYVFTSVLLLAVLIGIRYLFPWDYLLRRRREAVEEAKSAGIRLKSILLNKEVMKVLVLGDIPLNIGLMYVVAFLPVYMNYIGQSALSVSYAYLINGICGVYLGVFLLKMLYFMSAKAGMIFTMLLGAGGILVLSAGQGLGVVLLSAAIMGLFDGYGTPRVTGYFAAMPQVAKVDTAQMLTVFNIVGSAVQIVCPLLYNLTMQENGGTGYLMILGAAYLVMAGLLLLFVKGIKQ